MTLSEKFFHKIKVENKSVLQAYAECEKELPYKHLEYYSQSDSQILSEMVTIFFWVVNYYFHNSSKESVKVGLGFRIINKLMGVQKDEYEIFLLITNFISKQKNHNDLISVLQILRDKKMTQVLSIPKDQAKKIMEISAQLLKEGKIIEFPLEK